ncbi:uncharacterized protein GIQ15_02074 [Arthroderma uncinatum]|uniref:uncharacterized protein n=1 Tax=Arthroderma uncinatum TaxID=74035 RepID=UPI00144AA33E|nr:uncharacterized protein GIQ15_02074 [Arthroderma uncinatum]KAF3482750.1 hypothetical protein GIQ15_02074 [Arthroderma uncinatum]
MHLFNITPRNRVRKPWQHQPRPSTSIAGRQIGRLSISQYTARSSYTQRPPEAPSHQRNNGGQPLFRPPAALNHIFEPEVDENESKEYDDSSENGGIEEGNSGESNYQDPVNLTGGSLPAADIIGVTTLPKDGARGFGTRINPPSGNTGKASQSSQSSQSSTISSQKSMSDIEAESWLQLRLAQEEAKKKRTVYAPFPPTSAQPRQPPSPASPTPIRPPNPWCVYKPIDRKQSASLQRLETLEQAFNRLEQRGQMTERSEVEKMEFENFKAKADRDITLSATERKRISDILRNIERREYNWSVGQLYQRKNGAKRKGEQATRGDGTNQAAEGVNAVKPKAKAKSSLNIPSSRVDEAEPASFNINPATSNGPVQPEIAEEDELPDAEVELSSDEDEHEDDDVQGDAAPELVWVYNVYRTDIDPTDPDPTTVHISSHMNKLRAEDVMRDQIRSCYGSLKDRTRLEFHATIQEDSTEQSVEFATGRTVVVKVERELFQEPVKRKKRTRLEHIPTKIYTIVEQITTTVAANDEPENGLSTTADKDSIYMN